MTANKITTYKADLHIHSNHSDGKLSIPEIVDLYGSKGYGAIAITDHLCEQNTLPGKVSHKLSYSLSEDTFAEYIAEIRAEADRALETYGLLLIPGYEITKNSFANHRSAHIVILGTDKFIDPELPVEDILTIAQNHKALTIAAHPFFTGDFEFQSFQLWANRNKFEKLIDAWEVNHRAKICPDVLNSGLPLIANSDFHHLGHLRSWNTKVSAEKTQESLFSSIRAQKLDFFLNHH